MSPSATTASSNVSQTVTLAPCTARRPPFLVECFRKAICRGGAVGFAGSVSSRPHRSLLARLLRGCGVRAFATARVLSPPQRCLREICTLLQCPLSGAGVLQGRLQPRELGRIGFPAHKVEQLRHGAEHWIIHNPDAEHWITYNPDAEHWITYNPDKPHALDHTEAGFLKMLTGTMIPALPRCHKQPAMLLR